jgi:hypothetical protein
LHNAQRLWQKVNSAKDVFMLHKYFCKNFNACFRVQLGCRAPYFGAFLPIAVAIIRIKIHLRKICSALAPKMLLKFTPGAKCHKKNLCNLQIIVLSWSVCPWQAFPA